MVRQALSLKSRRAPDKRSLLLEAALELFETRGFDGVAVPEIARAAGVAIGSVYRYFATKEALVNALYRQWRSAYNQVVMAPVPAHFGPRQAFGFRWQRLMLFARTAPRPMRFLTLHHHAPYLDAESRALEAADRAAMETVLAELNSTLAPPLGAALVWGAAAGLLKFAEGGRLVLDAGVAADTEAALWRAIGPR